MLLSHIPVQPMAGYLSLERNTVNQTEQSKTCYTATSLQIWLVSLVSPFHCHGTRSLYKIDCNVCLMDKCSLEFWFNVVYIKKWLYLVLELASIKVFIL